MAHRLGTSGGAVAEGWLATPIGWLRVRAGSEGILSVAFVASRRRSVGRSGELSRVLVQLDEYFRGKRNTFDVVLGSPPTSAFAARVREGTFSVPYGQVRTYGELARAIGEPQAARAVGMALAHNPFAIVVPCHRIVPAGARAAGGYAWGARRKQWLLEWERAHGEAAGTP